MPEMLQESNGGSGETTTIVRPTALILDNEYCTTMIDFVRAAKSEIRLCAYSWRWYENEPEIDIQKLNVELLRARDRGVRVRCLVDTLTQKERFATLGFNVRSVINTRMLHTKALCIDAKTLAIGSHNMTKRANTDNYEMSILTQDIEPCLQFIEYFDKMWDSRG